VDSLPVYFLADEQHTHGLTTKAYLPTIVSSRVLWHLGYTEGRQGDSLDPVLWGVSTRGIPAGSLLSRPRGAH